MVGLQDLATLFMRLALKKNPSYGVKGSGDATNHHYPPQRFIMNEVKSRATVSI